jgi:hypothetical protein
VRLRRIALDPTSAMLDLIAKALGSTRESKHIEFKRGFDPNSQANWCEVVKDIVAIANSGGGIILFGLDSSGKPSGQSVEAIEGVDPADLANKIAKYTGPVDLEFEIRQLKKNDHLLVALVIQGVTSPLIFQKPGTYEVEPGKQRSAFGVGTVYFRHGAKSEPGNTEDLRKVIDRQVAQVRRAWLSGVRKLVHAPPGSRILTTAPARGAASATAVATTVRAVNDPKAIPVVLTRDSAKAVGQFYHEGISEGIFEEINNVVEANRVLARGQQHFFLGQPVYYRVYAERQHVTQNEQNYLLLLNSGAIDSYCPAIFWLLHLSDPIVAQTLLKLYLQPKSPQIHTLMRLAILLGAQFSTWLFSKWQKKWGRHSQPPSFYWTFKEMLAKLEKSDARVVAARTSIAAQLQVPRAAAVRVEDLLDKPDKAAAMLSKACMSVFEGISSERSTARDLDYLAYGLEVEKRASALSEALIDAIGDRPPGEALESTEAAESLP